MPPSSPLACNGQWRSSASRIFNTGDVVEYDGATYQAAWSTRDQVPGAPTGPWEQIGAPDANGIAAWTASMIYNTGDKADYRGVVYQAQWYRRDLAPGPSSGGAWKAIEAEVGPRRPAAASCPRRGPVRVLTWVRGFSPVRRGRRAACAVSGPVRRIPGI